jgi:site-specific DNA-cytosine methylase
MARGEAVKIDDSYVIVVWDAFLKKETTLTLSEDLRTYEPDLIPMAPPLTLEPGQVSMVDFFAGAGLAGRGAEDAGAKTVATVEIDPDCNRHLAANHPELAARGALITTPIEDVSYLQIMGKTGIPRGHLGHIHGSPCCQGFSGANHDRHWKDSRNTLTLDMLRLIRDLLPESFTWENVVGVKTYDMDPVTMILMSAMLCLPYRFLSIEVHGQNFDCAQDRPRNFILAIREDLGVTPTMPRLSTDAVSIVDLLPHVQSLRAGSGAKQQEYAVTGVAPTFTRDGTVEVKVDGQWRPTTIQEHRILSGVPEDFEFVGDLDDSKVQEEIKERLGNCVMPRVMERIFRHLRSQIDQSRALPLAA